MRVVELEDKENEVKVALGETLVNHSDVSSRDNENLGRTLLEHSINTGDNRKLGPPPRDVPLVFKDEKKQMEQTLYHL